jgi:thiamine pyrophosphate-dependent acetolactate synthase large subunit-like protein
VVGEGRASGENLGDDRLTGGGVETVSGFPSSRHRRWGVSRDYSHPGVRKVMQRCDTLLMVGTNMPYSDLLPEEGKVNDVQTDIYGVRIGFRFPDEVNRVGDSKESLRALMPIVHPTPFRRGATPTSAN